MVPPGRWTTGSPATTRRASLPAASTAARCCCGSTTRIPGRCARCSPAQAVTELAGYRLMAMVEPLPYRRDADGTLVLRQDAASLARAVTVASALGTTSAYTWLKMPACDDPDVVYLSLIHISEPTRRTPISYAVFCLKKK